MAKSVFDRMNDAMKEVDAKVGEVKSGKKKVSDQIAEDNAIVNKLNEELSAVKLTGDVKEVIKKQKEIRDMNDEIKALKEYEQTYTALMTKPADYESLYIRIHSLQTELDTELEKEVKPLLEKIRALYDKYHGASVSADECITNINFITGANGSYFNGYGIGTPNFGAMYLLSGLIGRNVI